MWLTRIAQSILAPFLCGSGLRWLILGCPGLKQFVGYWMSSDAMFCYGFLAIMREEKWLPFTAVRSSRWGFPEQFSFPQWPLTDMLHWTLMHLINIPVDNSVVVYNLYYLLGAGLICLSMFWVCRSLEMNFSVSLIAGLLYSSLPFALERLYHIFLASYFQVPLLFFVLLHFQKRVEAWKLIAIGMIIGGTGAYFAFFSVTLMGISFLVLAAIQKGRIHDLRIPFRNAFLSVSALLLVFVASLLPTWIHNWQTQTPGSQQRTPNESLIWGLHVEDIVLPPFEHWFPLYAEIRPLFFSWDYLKFRSDYEGNREYLGLIVLIGLFLCFRAIIQKFMNRKKTNYATPDSRLPWLGLAAAWVFLLGLKYGLGYLFALTISPSLRSWNRASLFIATAGMIAFFIWLSPRLARLSRAKRWACCLIILVVGLAEQGTIWRPIQPDLAAYQSDVTFSHQIKEALGEGVVLTLPFGVFPEWKGYSSVETYAPIRYLAYDTVRSTFPAVKGTSLAQRQLERFFERILTPEDLLNYGLAGAVVDRKDYLDGGAAQLSALRRPGFTEITSPDGRFVLVKVK